jgi:hypothetical protein
MPDNRDMHFELSITSETTLMRSRLDVAYALDGVSKRLRGNNMITKAPIRDTSGNQVGSWTISDEDATPVEDDPAATASDAQNLAEILRVGEDLEVGAQARLKTLRGHVEAALRHLVHDDPASIRQAYALLTHALERAGGGT